MSIQDVILEKARQLADNLLDLVDEDTAKELLTTLAAKRAELAADIAAEAKFGQKP